MITVIDCLGYFVCIVLCTSVSLKVIVVVSNQI